MSEAPTGSTIYDLGYRPYDGQRLGRRKASWSLYIYSLRAVFGLGRSTWNKLFPIGLFVICLLPAAVQLAVAALIPIEISLVAPEQYFGYIQIVVVLFAAVTAPEIVGRDQRNHTLPLYFSRALSRFDYLAAKVGALFTAVLLVIVVPQTVLFLGNAIATEEISAYVKDNAHLLPPIAASSIAVAAFIALVSVAIASQSSKRGLSTGAVIVYFIVFTALGEGLMETTTGDVSALMLLISPQAVMEGTVFWVFNAAPTDSLAQAGLPGYVYFLALVAYVGVAAAWLARRFLRLAL
jgi:ABC-2 type transport system permease protein